MGQRSASPSALVVSDFIGDVYAPGVDLIGRYKLIFWMTDKSRDKIKDYWMFPKFVPSEKTNLNSQTREKCNIYSFDTAVKDQ